MAFRTIGKALPRIEGEGKVTGQTKYAADLPFEDLLWAKVLRASVPHAHIVKVDTRRPKRLQASMRCSRARTSKIFRRHKG